MSAAPSGNARVVKVLHVLPAPAETTQYVDLITATPTDVEDLFFTWRKALLERYDILHIHWPDRILRGGRSWAHRAVRALVLDAILLRNRLLRRKLLRTMHNTSPHEAGSVFERVQLWIIDRLTDHYIVLNPTTQVSGGSTLIPHAHYREPFERYVTKDARSAGPTILYFGLIRPYKGVEDLIRAFRGLDVTPDVQLRVVGKPLGDMSRVINALAREDDRVSLSLSFVSDQQLVNELQRSRLVVLPYRQMHNSGAALAALSVGRPILVPNTPANAVLADEVGREWVFTYDGQIQPSDLEAAWQRARARDGELPSLDGRDRRTIGEMHAEVYRSLLTPKVDEPSPRAR